MRSEGVRTVGESEVSSWDSADCCITSISVVVEVADGRVVGSELTLLLYGYDRYGRMFFSACRVTNGRLFPKMLTSLRYYLP